MFNDSSPFKQDEYKHVGQIRYTAPEIIKIRSSYYENELSIFKPRSFMQMCIDKCRTDHAIKIANQFRKLHHNMYPRNNMRFSRESNYGMYVLVYGKDNPFSEQDLINRLVYEDNIANYYLYKFMISNVNEPDFGILVDNYIKHKRKFKVSGFNLAFLRMAGVNVD